MNKMVKGAVVTGIGVILLVGGGGTLATWNQAQNATMGSVVSGDLNLTPVTTTAGKGQWTNAAGTKIDVATYKVVPGDVLTYTQGLNVTLTGDLMSAKLMVTGAGVDNGFGSNVVIGATKLTKGTDILPTTVLLPADSGVVTASTTFTFKTSTTGRGAAGSTYDFSGIGYLLVQQAPASANAS
ncbi:hypothetical protein AL755_06215 [Arthrobacter sp. ERGS1:01]|uniref:alternate-type signal peptide domain-containing protein n=1 Tax=Arthrobacter sp. ERGS1:01 TaxID=1704044 RepID=UPI0006B586B9|nr:alternate-type signal peptide domain-containing protein [Arthrobacter sp. ERGS1:01]ALE05168.1 hypothetical protein AL755_06215 [Arthrobacter sp. ERGS1:01]